MEWGAGMTKHVDTYTAYDVYSTKTPKHSDTRSIVRRTQRLEKTGKRKARSHVHNNTAAPKDKETQTHRHTDTRHTDTQTHDTQTHIHTAPHTHKPTDTQTHTHTYTQKHTHTQKHPYLIKKIPNSPHANLALIPISSSTKKDHVTRELRFCLI